MPCYHPVDAWHSRSVGKGITFSPKDAYIDRPLKVPCGQCIGCRIRRSREWAIRCAHEASLYEDNCSITLTYSDEHVPYDMSLNVGDFQRFMKRLRKRFSPRRIRFFHSGEYGDKTSRPHYHALLFNCDFDDKYVWRKSNAGHLYYRSDVLDELWGLGHSEIGECNYSIAAYVARYIMKKRFGPQQKEFYIWTDPETGVIYDRAPEYSTMSRRPGIGKGWFDKYWQDILPTDFIVWEGKKHPVPEFYLALYEEIQKNGKASVKGKRKRDAKEHADNNTKERLAIREKVQVARMRPLKRSLSE